MADVIITATVRLGWLLLAKLPWLFGRLIRRAFPESKCREDLRLSISATHARFELLTVRPTPALCGLSVQIYNALPFVISLEFTGANFVFEGSVSLGQQTLNRHVVVPAAGFVILPLPEWSLADHTADWLRRRGHECAHLHVTLEWHCASDFRRWSSSQSFEVLARINRDQADDLGRFRSEA